MEKRRKLIKENRMHGAYSLDWGFISWRFRFHLQYARRLFLDPRFFLYPEISSVGVQYMNASKNPHSSVVYVANFAAARPSKIVMYEFYSSSSGLVF